MEACPSPGTLSERGKLFVGGISSGTGEETLREHFTKYGQVEDVVVIRDRVTGNGRGFAFVQFADADVAQKALDESEKDKHVILGRTVEVKRAIPRTDRYHNYQSPHHIQHNHWSNNKSLTNENNTPVNPNNYSVNPNNYSNPTQSKKIFVGGLRDNITQSEFRGYFEKFGTINDVVVMYDNTTNRSRGFGFITFDSEEAVQKVMERNFHELNGRMVEVKIAVPKDGNNNNYNSNNYNGNFNYNYNYNNYNYNNMRMFGGRVGPAFGGAYNGGIYTPPYGPKYGFFNGYMNPYSYVTGGYGFAGVNYSGVYQRRGPMVMPYGIGDFAGHANGGGFGYYGLKVGQVGPDMQSEGAGQMDGMMLDAQ